MPDHRERSLRAPAGPSVFRLTSIETREDVVRWMRQTRWGEDGCRKETVVVSEKDFSDDIHVVAHRVRGLPGAHAIDIEVFECDGDLLEAGIEATRRAQRRFTPNERARGVLFDWAVWGMTAVKPYGILATPDRTPLEVSEIQEILEDASRHPFYENQRIVVFARDGRVVRLREAKTQVLLG